MDFIKGDTICAVATPPGAGALAIIRLSGPDTEGVLLRVTGTVSEVRRATLAGLAGGSTIGGECGAVASAYLVLGLEYGITENESLEQAMHVMMKIKQFVARFTEKHGAINCVELLGLDPTTEEGMKEAMEKNLFGTKCVAQVRDAVAILDSIIAEG